MTRKAAAALLVFGLMHIVRAGPLDAALNWARADKLPIEIDVNLPWLPCKLQLKIVRRVQRMPHHITIGHKMHSNCSRVY